MIHTLKKIGLRRSSRVSNPGKALGRKKVVGSPIGITPQPIKRKRNNLKISI